MEHGEKIRRVMWGREERPLTVFVPWDCKRFNHRKNQHQ